MRKALAIYLLWTIASMSACDKKDEVSALVGNWKLDKVIYKTNTISSEVALGTTVISAKINKDGSYTYEENGATKAGQWRMSGDHVVFTHADSSTDELTATVADGQLKLEVLTVNLQSTSVSESELMYIRMARLAWITEDKAPGASESLQVVFVMKPSL